MKLVLRIGAVLLCITALLCLLPACTEKNDPFAVTGFSSLTVEKNGTVTAVVGLNMTEAEAHSGERAYLYELLPGENLTDLHGKRAVADAPIATSMRFAFPLREEGHTRLYSSFAVCYENGKLLVDSARAIDNPAALASCTIPFQGKYSPKGLNVSDVESAASLGVTHAMLTVSLSELCGGNGLSYSFEGTDYLLSSSALRSLDRKVREAHSAGMQVSLQLSFDADMTETQKISLLDFLSARYAGGELGTVTALFIDADDAKEAGTLASFAGIALTSHVKNGRIYVVCDEKTVDDAEEFFLNVSEAVERYGKLDWGAAIVPAATEALPWEPSTDDALNVQSLSSLYETLQSYEHRPIYYAVCGLRFGGADEDKQAVALAYSYAKAIEAGSGLVYYGSHIGSSGLLNSLGAERTSAEMFRRLDLGLEASQVYLCQSTSQAVWETVGALKPSRTLVGGNTSGGFGAGEVQPLFDFTSGGTYGFDAIGGMSEPQSRDSAAWGKPVLYTWLNAKNDTTGLRKSMADGTALMGVSALSLQLLAQYDAYGPCFLTLRLVGSDTQGSTVTYESVGGFESRKWQTVTFDISDFVAQADLTAPCTLTVLCTSESESDESFVLFLKGIYSNLPQGGTNMILPIALTVLGILLGFLLILILYRRARVLRRKRG